MKKRYAIKTCGFKFVALTHTHTHTQNPAHCSSRQYLIHTHTHSSHEDISNQDYLLNNLTDDIKNLIVSLNTDVDLALQLMTLLPTKHPKGNSAEAKVMFK